MESATNQIEMTKKGTFPANVVISTTIHQNYDELIPFENPKIGDLVKPI